MTVEEAIARDWADVPQVRDACFSLVKELRASPRIEHYTLNSLGQIAHVDDLRLVSEAALYLASARLGVLEPSLMYEVNGKILLVDDDELAAYAKGRPIVHPISGREMSDDQLMVAFVPGRALKGAGASE